ncbi:hypothetical protein CAPTEDRAFT_99484 [Capitella teleta]|uniref:Uncharacterized protein n=1 Tax=Capitella teleta TaxID=283909 RepID=R7U250_CAPTE|nr:hypothetical protein CAPTEDRAFT_99484 [Capitella teleta]|eukprot:ELU00410.1 hypothetical protein CAPTEDRAFT_99484 [Capitella teleta]
MNIHRILFQILLPHLLSYEIVSLSAFHLAAMTGHNDVLITFIDHDIPVDIGLQSGTTALHLASLAGKPETVGVLIDIYKAEINRKDNYGWTAVHYAATEGHLDVLHVLVAGGADVTLRDKDGTAAAFRANVNGHSDVVSYLIERGDPEMLNVDDNDDDDNELKRQSYHVILYFHRHGRGH